MRMLLRKKSALTKSLWISAAVFLAAHVVAALVFCKAGSKKSSLGRMFKKAKRTVTGVFRAIF